MIAFSSPKFREFTGGPNFAVKVTGAFQKPEPRRTTGAVLIQLQISARNQPGFVG